MGTLLGEIRAASLDAMSAALTMITRRVGYLHTDFLITWKCEGGVPAETRDTENEVGLLLQPIPSTFALVVK